MKTKSEIAAGLYVVLLALREAKKNMLGGVPNGHLYAQLQNHFNIDEWAVLISGMVGAGSITQQNYLLKITPHGEDVLKTLESVYTAAKQQEAK